MNSMERIKMVKAMEFIARQINDEDIFERWLTYGVADGDISYGDLIVKETDVDDLCVYFDDDTNFRDIMNIFLTCMVKAKNSGGLYCDRVTSE